MSVLEYPGGSALIGCVVFCLSSCANSKVDEERFEQAMRTVNVARPRRTLPSNDAENWSKLYAGKVIKVRGRIEHLSLHMGALALNGEVHCYLARDQEMRWPLTVGSVVTLKGLLGEEEPAELLDHGTPMYACVILETSP